MSYEKLWDGLVRVLPLVKREDGQALGEYSLILTLVAMAAVLALTALGAAIAGFWDPLLNVL
jgi:Flp pilus assembly pilin Flp